MGHQELNKNTLPLHSQTILMIKIQHGCQIMKCHENIAAVEA